MRLDTEDVLNRRYYAANTCHSQSNYQGIVPENGRYRHTMEGSDDMPAHVKSSLFGVSLTIPVTNGKLNLGTWQGIWLCEHRDNGTAFQDLLFLLSLTVLFGRRDAQSCCDYTRAKGGVMH